MPAGKNMKQFSICLPLQLYEELKTMAKQSNRSLNEVCCILIFKSWKDILEDSIKSFKENKEEKNNECNWEN